MRGVRLRNVRANPWASLVVMSGERDEDEIGAGEYHRAVTAEGAVAVHELDALDAVAGQWERRHRDPPRWAEAVLELRPERLFSHDSGSAAES